MVWVVLVWVVRVVRVVWVVLVRVVRVVRMVLVRAMRVVVVAEPRHGPVSILSSCLPLEGQSIFASAHLSA